MCRYPLRIQNKGYNPKDNLSPRFVSVPCGHCPECKQHKISEYLYRCTYEYDYTIKEGGFACFLTLTFNRDSANIVTYSDGTTCTTWNNDLLTKFKHRLEKWLSRLGYSLRYVCTCERGHNGTKRPHYHLILFIVPAHPVVSLTDYEVSLTCARLWSHKPRNNRALDISMKYSPFKPKTRFVAQNSPIGFIFNERISRTEHEAIKYVVKYCVKDSADATFNSSNIVDSRFPISEIAMRPRTTQSNGIGISYFDTLPYVTNNSVDLAHNIETAVSLYSSRPLASDGTPVNIPRYYIKKIASQTDKICRYPLHDDTVYFDGVSYSPKFAHDTPVYILGNKFRVNDLFNAKHPCIHESYTYRDRWYTKTQPNVFGVFLGNLSLQETCTRMWNTLCSLREYQFNFVANPHLDFLYLADSFYLLQVQRIIQSNIDFTPLFLMGYKKFSRLYAFAFHNVRPCNAPNYSLLSQFLTLCGFSSSYNGIENSELNAIRYKDNLISALLKRPLLFIDRNE